MKSKFITLLFCTFFVASLVYSQTKIPFGLEKSFYKITVADTAKTSKRSISPYMLVSPSFYSNNLAFFCRQEIKFEKVTKIPLKFRLGSVQQVDYLEGKKGTFLFP
ncbi:MAG: hypothetical protein LH615_15370 [Ferruginibacter sp.]|nr:hypothetical protein [Ferruginibacter sp.]